MKAVSVFCVLLVLAVLPSFTLGAQEQQGLPKTDERLPAGVSPLMEVPSNMDWSAIAEHLTYYGYKTEVVGQELYATSDVGHNLAFSKGTIGMLISAFYVNDSEHTFGCDFYEKVNSTNAQAQLVRTYYDPATKTFVLEGYYTAEYDRAKFATYFTSLLAEFEKVLNDYASWLLLNYPPAAGEQTPN